MVVLSIAIILAILIKNYILWLCENDIHKVNIYITIYSILLYMTNRMEDAEAMMYMAVIINTLHIISK